MNPQQLNRIGTAISWMAVLLCLLAAMLVLAAKSQSYELLSVQSNSMRPLISRGDAVLVDRGERLPRVGDIVSYVSPRNRQVVITHRVVAFDGRAGTFVAQGDNTQLADPQAPVRNIIGTVRYHVPVAGFLFDFFRKPYGLVLAVYLPAAGIVIAEVRRLGQHFSGLGPDRYIHHRFYQP